MLANQITITSPECRSARVKIRLHLLHPLNGDIGGEIRVDTQQPLARCAECVCIKVRYLLRSVHTSVSTTRSGDSQRMISNCCNRLRQKLLDAASVTLRLPTYKVRAVVFKAESDTHNRRQ